MLLPKPNKFDKASLEEMFNRPIDEATGPISKEIGELKLAGKLLLDGKDASVPKPYHPLRATRPPLEVTTLRAAVEFLRAKEIEAAPKSKGGRPAGSKNKDKEPETIENKEPETIEDKE